MNPIPQMSTSTALVLPKQYLPTQLLIRQAEGFELQIILMKPKKNTYSLAQELLVNSTKLNQVKEIGNLCQPQNS
ncbi:hypothetical protein VCHA53O466_50189 [Vibrio chagasii]|nr:hypothetical protein VCHA53O466_50189 [Vibrio chagasii]